ncbi:periplasmic binding protein/LacI transcriptional regulator [Rhodobacteraceae bacterium KLH11]|nr:periplasmic binding protein/LacI transcriptional regulator [Rhodobacteraceae bacterium KLH11]
MATIKDISKRLGISVTTVSRALNGYSDVNKDTRKRVQDTAKLLNYKPNQIARKLVTGQSGIVAMVLPDDFGITTKAIWFEIISGLSAAFSKREMDFVLNVSAKESILGVYQRMIDRGTADGFILIAPVKNDPRVAMLQANKVPFVIHGQAEQKCDYAYFDIDNYGLTRRSVDHLVELGHQRIAFISGPKEHGFVTWRVKGFRDAMAAHGLEVKTSWIRYAERMTENFGLVSAIQILGRGESAPTAFICGNTLIAKGVYKAAASLELSVPNDVSVVAHDDALPENRAVNFDPPLTVTRSPLRDSSEPLADLLVRRVQGEALETLQITEAGEFIARRSSASPPADT